MNSRGTVSNGEAVIFQFPRGQDATQKWDAPYSPAGTLCNRTLTDGPLFRPETASNSDVLSDRPFHALCIYQVVSVICGNCRGAVKRETRPEGWVVTCCIYTPHSQRAIPARRDFSFGFASASRGDSRCGGISTPRTDEEGDCL